MKSQPALPRTVILFVIANALIWLAITGQRPSGAAPPERPNQPVNPAAQRQEIIKHLAAIQKLLQEQNRLLQEATSQ